jgi:hypothetical protein
MMDNKTKNRIINALRAISRSWKPRLDKKRESKVGPSTYECAKCKIWIYEGKSKASVEALLTEKGKEVIMDKVHMDHVESVVPLEGWKDFKDFSTNIIDRMLCDGSNFMTLCANCHASKTKEEGEQRKIHRHRKKAEQKL